VQDLETALRLKPKLIFCEKPVTSSVAQTERPSQSAQENIRSRESHAGLGPDISKLQAGMRAGQWVVCVRSRFLQQGILNNGSHMLDLLHRLIGPMDIVKVGKPIQDFFADDPTVPLLEGLRSAGAACLV